MLLRATAIWLGIMVLAITNGAVREQLIVPRLGAQAGHVISTLLLCAVIVLVAWASLRWIGPASRGDALRVGLCWLVLTLAFEFLAGHYLFGASWEQLLADYNVLRGRIWPLVPLTTFLAPLLVFFGHRGA